MLRVFSFMILSLLVVHMAHGAKPEMNKKEFIQLHLNKSKKSFVSKIKLSKQFDQYDLNSDNLLDYYELSLSPDINNDL